MKLRATTFRGLMLSLASAVLLAGCQPSAPGSPTGVDGTESRARPTRAVVANTAEIKNLSNKLVSEGFYSAEFRWLSNSPLTRTVNKRPIPLLAAELPSRDRGSWVVNPDGSMRTTWKIKPNARWHDGQPVVADDFVFAHAVYLDPGLPIERSVEQRIDRIEPLDARSFVVHWKSLYPWADELAVDQLPAHLMKATYDEGDPQAFLNHPFWSSTDYIGTGPYRIVQWDRGAQFVYRAFDDFFMGRPPIDEIVIRIIPDENTALANVLSGELDATLGTTIGLRAGLTIREQWTKGEGEVKFSPARWNYAEVQHDPARNRSPGLLDLRVRRAMMHGTDREALADASTQGAYPVPADIPIPREDPLYAELSPSVVKYPYDLRRALALLEEAGWVQRGGMLVDARGEPFSLEMRTLPGSGLPEIDMKVMAGDMRKLGIQVAEEIIPPSRAGDLEYRVTFPGLNVTQRNNQLPTILTPLHGEQCASAERRFSGPNRGCWKNAEFDRLYMITQTSLDASERDAAAMGAVRVLTEQLGAFGLAQSLETIAVKRGLVGPNPRGGDYANGATSNVYEWQWVQ